MSLKCIDLYETDERLLFLSESSIWKMTDLERVKEKAENILNFYLDFNWEFEFDNEKILLITLMRHFDSTLMQQDSWTHSIMGLGCECQ